MHRRALAWLLAAWCVSAPTSAARAQDPPDESAQSADEFLAGLVKRLATHKYFSKIVLVQERSYAPLLLLVQKPAIETPDFARQIADVHAPWLRKLDELFEEHYVRPLALERRSDTPLQAVAVLQTAGDYLNYTTCVPSTAISGAHASFERRSRLLVTYHEGLGPKSVPRNYPELVEYVRALLQAHYTGAGGEVGQSWIYEGLGGYLAFHAGTTPAALEQRTLDVRCVDFLVTLSQNAGQRAIYLCPIATLVGLADTMAWETNMLARGGAQPPDLEPRLFWQAYRAQCVLWMYFLHEVEGVKYRQRLMTYLGSALRGNGSSDVFRKAFEGLDLAALDREFYAWLYRQYAAALPARALDVAVLEQLFKSRGPAAAATPQPPAAFDPRSLAASDDDLAAAHGRALQLVRIGRLAEARALLEPLVARAQDSPLEGRLERELSRLAKWIEMRDAFFAAAIAGGAKLSLDVDGKKLITQIARVDGERVYFGENRRQVESAPLSSFRPYDLARDLPRKLVDSADGWIRLYPYVLEGDEKFKRGGSGDAAELTDLRADAQEWYPGLLRLGAAADALAALAQSGVPTDPGAARIYLDRIRALRETWGDLQLVQERAPALTQAATLALGAAFDPSALVAQFAGQLELLDGGRARITYEFERPAEFADFEKLTGYLARWHDGRAPTRQSERATNLIVAGGTLRGAGVAVYRLALALATPITARYAFRTHYVPDGSTAESSFMVAVCDDGRSNYVGCEALGGLRAIDSPSETWEVDFPPPMELDPSREYAVELRLAGTRCVSFVDGVEARHISIGPRNRGDVLIAIHSDCKIESGRLEIEGALDLERARSRWIAAQLAALGLAP